MVQRHTIPHLKVLIVANKIPGGQRRGSIMGLPRLLLQKSSIYHKDWAWQANKSATDLKGPLPDLSNELLLVFVLFSVLSKIDEI